MADTYTAQLLFDGDALHERVRVTVDDGVVTSIEPFDGIPDNYLISPGLIDVQMNGFRDVDVATATKDEFEQLDAHLLRHGTTSWLGTIVTAPLERLSSSVTTLNNLISGTDTGCVGLHVEGPFLGAAPGAHNPAWIIPFDRAWCSSLPSIVKLMTVAPEQVGVNENIAQLVAQGIVVSVGHTGATRSEFTSSIDSGARMVTHLFNGMTGVHHRDGGVALFALTNPTVITGLIADLVHVSPEAINLAFAVKGGSGVCLVSDSVAWMSQWAVRRGIQVMEGAPRLADGTLAGSSTPLSHCLNNVVRSCGVPLLDALIACTRTPAQLLGYPQKGRVMVGERADLVVFDEELSVVEARRGLVSIRG